MTQTTEPSINCNIMQTSLGIPGTSVVLFREADGLALMPELQAGELPWGKPTGLLLALLACGYQATRRGVGVLQ